LFNVEVSGPAKTGGKGEKTGRGKESLTKFMEGSFGQKCERKEPNPGTEGLNQGRIKRRWAPLAQKEKTRELGEKKISPLGKIRTDPPFHDRTNQKRVFRGQLGRGPNLTSLRAKSKAQGENV